MGARLAMKLQTCMLVAASVVMSFTPLSFTPVLRGQETSPTNLFSVDASKPIGMAETGYLHAGGRSSTGHTLEVNSRYLVLDGKPWLPVMGEFHFSRYPQEEWEDEILKIKAGGVNIISTYIFWIHHEEVEGQFDWTGQRDLRKFVQLCAKHGMYVWLRPGPWGHGEVRNGGFPDWVVKLPHTRSTDPTYMHYVARFYGQIGLQVKGMMFQDGGPVIGAQLENEYGEHGPGRGAEYILKLKQVAIAAGISPPLFTVTGWPSLDFPPREVIPVYGGYPDGFWFGSTKNQPPAMNYLFNFNRELGDMGATVPTEDPTGKVDLNHYPFFAAEKAGGMESAYHRRPVMSPDDITALVYTGIGSGINLYGYYMYHGGANPRGKQTTMQESVASGFPNDLPEVSYDFAAPLGEFGQERESYRKTRVMHLFLNAYGSELAAMPAFAPEHHTKDAADTSAARIAVRSDGKSGYVFVNNYVRQLDMPSRNGFQVRIKVATGAIAVPAEPVRVPANSYFAWPFNLAVGRATLRYSTAQLMTRLETPAGRLMVFVAIPGLKPEFAFDGSGTRNVTAAGAHTTRAEGLVTVSEVTPGMNSVVEVTDASGGKTRLLVLTEKQAERTTLLHAVDGDHLAMSESAMLFDGKELRLRSTASPVQQVALLPALRLSGGSEKQDGLWATYTFSQPEKRLDLTVTETQAATARAKMEMGPYVEWRKEAVPTVPPDAAFDQAGIWKMQWKNPDMAGLSEVLLQMEYTGDMGRLYSGAGPDAQLMDDNFYNGVTWQVGLKRFDFPNGPITLKLLPMPKSAPVYLDARARELLEHWKPTPKLMKAELVPEYEAVGAVLR